MPFAGYKDFDSCVAKNSDKEDPKAYCADIMRKTEKHVAEDIVDTLTQYVTMLLVPVEPVIEAPVTHTEAPSSPSDTIEAIEHQLEVLKQSRDLRSIQDRLDVIEGFTKRPTKTRKRIITNPEGFPVEVIEEQIYDDPTA